MEIQATLARWRLVRKQMVEAEARTKEVENKSVWTFLKGGKKEGPQP